MRSSATEAEITKKKEKKKRLSQQSKQGLSMKSILMSPCLCLSAEVRQPAWPTVSGRSTIIIIYAGSAFGLGPIAHDSTGTSTGVTHYCTNGRIYNHCTDHGHNLHITLRSITIKEQQLLLNGACI